MKTNTISDIPHQIWKYVTFKHTFHLPANHSARFYLSWEDALWDLIKAHDLIGKTIAVPDFFCGDVMHNMTQHGLRVITYTDPANRPQKSALSHSLHALSPESNLLSEVDSSFAIPSTDILVIFHPVGIHNPLIDRIQELDPDMWVIEDCVHQIIDPQEVKITRRRHVMIDSWRKVMPLQGSMMLGRAEDLAYVPTQRLHTISYELEVVGMWLLMQVLALAGFARQAQQIMLRGYETIGDSPLPGRTPRIFSWLRQHIDYAKIRTLKTAQMDTYHRALDHLIERDPRLFTFAHTPADWPHMRAFPLGIYLGENTKSDSPSSAESADEGAVPSHHGGMGWGCGADDILARLRASGLLVRYELNDCEWSEKQKVVYLPLGPEWEVEDICNRIVAHLD